MVDAPKSGLACGPFLHIRVDIDITKPLMRGKMIHIEYVEEGWVFFKYERLPIDCYHCGILGHQDCKCQNIKKGFFSLDDEDFQFGPYLHAMPPKFSQEKSTLTSQVMYPTSKLTQQFNSQGIDSNL